MIPFLKWAGGKRWLFDSEFISSLPPYRRYIEPFLGAGAGFFAVKPRKAVLSDINRELIELYEVVRDYPHEIEAALSSKQGKHCREYYYSVRAEIPDRKVERAARTLYLNRTCWNGLYRLNRDGLFNVPMGTKNAIIMPTDDFLSASALLKTAEIHSADFEKIIDKAKDGDLIFADPPYTVKHNLNGFIKYNENLFAWEDQVRLRNALGRAVDRGAKIILTNADHFSVSDLYSGFGKHVKKSRFSIISGKKSGRSSTSELLVVA